jgi:tetratricopeptide (TPR) repeat protein
MRQAAVCGSCGAKFRAGAPRCPRCRTLQAALDPAVDAARSRRLARATAAIVFAFVLTAGGLWFTRGPSSGAAAPVPPAPTAALRAGGEVEGAASAQAETPSPERPFLDPSGAGALAYASGDYASALQQFQDAVDRNPRDAESLSNLGQVLVRLGRTQEAIPLYRRAIEEIPDRWAYHFNLARAFGLLGRWQEAIPSYRTAQRLFPDDYATAFNLALALHKIGQDAAAVDEYKRAIDLNPEDGSFHLAIALSYERLQRPVDAAAAYGEYLRLLPEASDADKVRARIAQLTNSPADPTGSVTR